MTTLSLLFLGLTYALVRAPWLGARIETSSERLMAFILIGLGLHILAKGLLVG